MSIIPFITRWMNLLVLPLVMLAGRAQAQAPNWASALTLNQSAANGTAVVRATALNANGDVLVAGTFTGQVGFGTTLLSSTGGTDAFVAKYSVNGGTWAWAVASGGTGADQGLGVAVSGNTVYLTGAITNTSTNANNVQVGGQALAGASTTSSTDVFLAKYTDTGTNATYGWAAAGGGTGADQGTAVAVSGPSVYVTGTITNDGANTNAVQFGGATLAGASATASTDVLLLRYTDAGSNGIYDWAVAGGGTGADQGNGLAVSGSAVYVTGAVTNNGAGVNAVKFGGTTLAGASSNSSTSTAASTDLFLTKYTDAGTSATYQWATAGGGTGADQGNGLAVSGAAVYVTGAFTNTSSNNNSVRFGGALLYGATSTSSTDVVLARYADAGTRATLAWAVAGGGTGTDAGQAVAVSGTNVYLTGTVTNSNTNRYRVQFGNSSLLGASDNATADVLVARYTDAGTSASYNWAVAGGGLGDDYGYGLAATSAGVQVGLGVGTSLGTFGTLAALPANAGGLATLATGTGDWQTTAATRTATGSVYLTASALNNNGDVLVTGYFYGQANIGNTLLTSAGDADIFIAKYSAGTWTWAVAGGGTGAEQSVAIAVSGASIYVAGSVGSNSFGPARFGNRTISSAGRTDALVLKCLDAGTSASFSWVTGGGGASEDYATGLAVNGTSVYVVGNMYNNSANDNNVYFGGYPLPGLGGIAYYVVVMKFIDTGATPTYGWATAGGGASALDSAFGRGIAASGTSVYVTGTIYNNLTDGATVRFGGVALRGASTSITQDAFLVKYIDAGTRATYGWGTAIGGTGSDYGSGLAVSGTSVYLTGAINNDNTNSEAVQVSGTPLAGLTTGTTDDVLVAKYTDLGTSFALGWVVLGGGGGTDRGSGLAVSGSRVYVTGWVSNNAANNGAVQFGSEPLSGASTSYSQDAFVARYTDNGSSATYDWATVGGGANDDQGYNLAANSQDVYLVAQVRPPGTFGSYPISGSLYNTAVLAHLVDAISLPLPVTTVPTLNTPADNATTNGTPTFSGAASAGSTVKLYVTAGSTTQTLATVTATSGGSFSFTPSSALASGSYSAYATAQASGSAVSSSSNTNTFRVDATAPTVTLSSPTAVSGNTTATMPFAFSVSFSESVAGFSTNGISVTNGAVTSGSLSGSGTTYTFSVTPTTAGTATTVRIVTNAAQDAAGNGSATSSNYSLTYVAPVTATAWTGSSSTDWSATSNWTAGVPTATLDATIPNGTLYSPLITTQSAFTRNLTLDPGATLTMSGGTLYVQADFTNNGSFVPTGGAVALGTMAQANGPNILGSSRTRFWNLVVNSNGVRLSTSAGASVRRQLALNGSLATQNNPFTVESDAAGTGLIYNNGGVIVGPVTVQRYISPVLNSGPGYRHFAAPVDGATVTSLATGSFTPTVNATYNTSATPSKVTSFPTVFGYDQNRLSTTTNNLSAFDKGWFSPGTLSDPLTVGQGYTVNLAADQTVSFTGSQNNNNISVNLTRNASGSANDANAGWALLGNPYPSPLDYAQVAAADRVGLDAAIYVFESTGLYTGSYRTSLNGVGGNSNSPNSLLALGQAFFVRVSDGLASGRINFRNSQRVTSYVVNPSFLRTAETRPLVQLTLQGNGSTLADEAYVYFEQGATDSFEPTYDAVKLPNSTGLNLSASSGGKQLAIDGRAPLGTAQQVVPLAMGVPAPGSYTLTAARLLNLSKVPVYLRDLQTGTLIDFVQQPTYSFSVTNASVLLTNRFELVLSPRQVLATVPVALVQQVTVYPNPVYSAATVAIELPAVLARQPVKVDLLDALGRVVRTQVLPAGLATHALPMPSLTAGVYSLRLTTSAGAVVKKLVVE